MPGTKLEAHAGSDKAWVWSTVDFSEGEQKVEMFCLRFGTMESESNRAPRRSLERWMGLFEGLRGAYRQLDVSYPLSFASLSILPEPPMLRSGAADFAKKFKEAMDINEKLIGTPATVGEKESDKAADELAGEVEKVAV
jgi:hypothetical protein